MSNPFLDRRTFNPEIATRVGYAYDRNVDKGLAAGTDFATDVSTQSLGNVIKGATIDAKANSNTGLTALDQISNPETKRAFEDSFAATERLFSRLDLAVPTAEQCADCGINMIALGDEYDRMQNAGLEPEIILSPNLDLASWHELYRGMQEDPLVNSYGELKDGGLVIGDMVASLWDSLLILPAGVQTVTMPRHRIEPTNTELNWSLRLIPGALKSTNTNVDHGHNNAIHPTVGEYLSLQAAHILSHRTPVDGDADGVWLSGRSVTGQAPIGVWGPSSGRVGLFTTNTSVKDATLGTRMPVWE